MKRSFAIRLFVFAIVLLPCSMATAAGDDGKVDFARHVYPILRRSCFECHGAEKQEGSLRLDLREKALQGGDSGAAWQAGQPDKSELLRRVMLPKGNTEVMPARGEPLSPDNVAILRRWIEQGATWPEVMAATQHWAYVVPKRPAAPKLRDATSDAGVQNDIDRFVRARLEQAGLHPAPEAEPAVLVRRVYLDLIGLPPSPKEVDAYLQDLRSDRYQRLVDDLLARPQFGERRARPWLDLARYADSLGFQRDDFRDTWAFRDWVIAALNADMPFDQFTIQQIAGDLLPNADEQSRIATGFHRCVPTNVEAGSEPEETRVNQVIDRVNTTGYVWLGTTLECAQCHDHKYDPFSQREYFGLFAFYNQTQLEADRTNPNTPGSIRFIGPKMDLKDPAFDSRRAPLQQSLAVLDEQLAVRRKTVADEVDERLARLRDDSKAEPAEQVLPIDDFDSTAGSPHRVLDDQSVLLVDDAPDRDTYIVTVKTRLTNISGIRLDALTDPSLPGSGPGRGDAVRPNFVLHSFSATAAPLDDANAKPVLLKFVSAEADFSQLNFDVSGAIDDDPKTAWAINPKFHESHWARFLLDKPIGFKDGTQFTFTLVQNFGTGRTIGRFRLSAITGPQQKAAVLPAEVAQMLEIPAERRSPAQQQKLVEFCLQSDDVARDLSKRHSDVERELQSLKPASTLVMQEIAQPRSNMIFQRGDFRTPGDSVTPITPAVLHKLPSGPTNRLTLARWLVDRQNPLVARVTVNRWWTELFGRGIVSTVEDFGLKGEPPTHPELLDWLAVEFMDRGWSMKQMLRTIVTSGTYRQSSQLTRELLAKDDQNKLLARGPRFRLDAETIRDNALAISGLLSLKPGGPPIRPYQPDGLWNKIGGEKNEYVVSPDSEQHRRGVYVVLKRGAPYPSFVNFDATARLACTVKRSRSNTPLQALTLLNDPVYVEAARALASRIITEQPKGDTAARIAYGFRLCVARQPTATELAVLTRLYEQQAASEKPRRVTAKGAKAKGAKNSQSAQADLDAWYSIATVLLNLDETITKG